MDFEGYDQYNIFICPYCRIVRIGEVLFYPKNINALLQQPGAHKEEIICDACAKKGQRKVVA